MKKSLAILRSTEPLLRGCPYGLSITISCLHAGTSIDQMKPLDEVPEEQREKFAAQNRKIYRHLNDGQHCKFLQGVIKNREMVNCNWGEAGGDEHQIPLSPSPFYPRVFQGMGQGGMFGWSLGDYSSNPDSNDSTPGILSGTEVAPVYAALEETPPNTTPNLVEALKVSANNFYEFVNSDLDPNSEVVNGNH